MNYEDEFNAILEEIKTWDINIPNQYDGYTTASGNHVMAIKNALLKNRNKIREQKIKRIL